jgi:cytoskeletal protein CcmA (bactofilin family)
MGPRDRDTLPAMRAYVFALLLCASIYGQAASARTAVVGKSVIVKGQIFSRENLTIDGEVAGTVELQEHRLTVGPNGKVLASVKACEIVVLGTVHGNLEATDKIEIRKEAKIVGDVKTARIVIEDGAYFKGNTDVVRAEAPRPVRAETNPHHKSSADDEAMAAATANR